MYLKYFKPFHEVLPSRVKPQTNIDIKKVTVYKCIVKLGEDVCRGLDKLQKGKRLLHQNCKTTLSGFVTIFK